MKSEYEFKIISEKRNLIFSENGKLRIIEDTDEHLFYHPIEIELREAKDTDEEEGPLVAKITGLYFNIDNIRDCGFNLFEVFDSISQTTYELYEALFDKEEYSEEFEIINQNLFYIENIEVREEYRNQGIFKMIMHQIDEIVKYIANLSVGIIATNVYKNENIENILVESGFIQIIKDKSCYVLEIY